MSAPSQASPDNRGMRLRIHAQNPETAAEDAPSEHQRCASFAVLRARARLHSHSCFDGEAQARAQGGKAAVERGTAVSSWPAQRGQGNEGRRAHLAE